MDTRLLAFQCKRVIVAKSIYINENWKAYIPGIERVGRIF
jgi:hypothetical protein